MNLKKFKPRLRLIAAWIGISFALLGYNNCSGLHSGNGMNSESSLGGTCEQVQINQYTQKIYPFFRQSNNCVGCHVEGGVGIGLFASMNPDTSFASFTAAGLTKVAYMATNEQHKPPYTGARNKPAVDALSAEWTTDQAQYLDCVSKAQNGGENVTMTTSAKKASTIYASNNAAQTLTWELDLAQDLSADATRSLPAKISIDVKVLYQTIAGVPTAKGYIFLNPVIQLKDPSKQVLIEGLFFQINGQSISSQTTFTSVSRVISGSNAVSLLPNVNANTLIEPITTQDTFALYLPRILLSSGVDSSPTPLTPILRVSDQETRNETLVKTDTVDALILRDGGIAKWCLSENATAPASVDAPCNSGLTGPGTDKGWSLTRPLTYKLSPGQGLKTIYLYVVNVFLKMNTDPAIATITMDSTLPAAPTIGNIQIIDTQVANMSVIHPNEPDVTGWCVWEQSVLSAVPTKPKLTDKCWSWTDNNAKPTTVGFHSGGTRNVWVFARDRAGNVSAASNMVSGQNNFGEITFTQLTATGGGPRAIFQNRCYTCHGTSSNPGYSKLQLFDYTSAVNIAKSGTLNARVNNPLSPMPNVNSGMMPQRDRDLIRLWTQPEQSTTPAP